MNKSQKTMLLTSFLLLAIYLSAYQSKEKLESSKPKTSIKHVILRDSLTSKFHTLKSNKLLLEIIPVKESDDVAKTDFNLLLSFQDPNGKPEPKNPKKKKVKPEFQKKAASYATYMKRTGVLEKDVAWGYYLMLDKSMLGPKDNVILSYSPTEQQVTYAVDSCRYPPGCYMTLSYEYVVIDSACKVPPGCPWDTQASSARIAAMRDLVKKQYKLNVEKANGK